SLTDGDLISSDRHRFRLVFNDCDLQILRHIEPLASVRPSFRGHTGIRARHGQASIIATEKSGSSWQRGITSGGQVTQYAVKWGGHWLKIEPSLLFAGGFDDEIIRQPKVLIRQTAD